jgi:hypothetical protein
MKYLRTYYDHLEKKYVTSVWEKPMLEDDGVPEHGTKFIISSWWTRSHYHKRYAVAYYRYDPVPGIHSSHGRFVSWYKNPKTMNEMRQYEGPEFTRGARRPRNLPNSWDDMPRSDCKIKRSWKKLRKEHQYDSNKRIHRHYYSDTWENILL